MIQSHRVSWSLTQRLGSMAVDISWNFRTKPQIQMLCHLYSAPKSSWGFLAKAFASMIKLNSYFAPCSPWLVGSWKWVTNLISSDHLPVATLLIVGGHLYYIRCLHFLLCTQHVQSYAGFPHWKHSSPLFMKLAVFWCTLQFQCKVSQLPWNMQLKL